MKSKIFLSFISLMTILISNAQSLEIKSFTPRPMDLSASTKPRLDNNGNYCALLKIIAPRLDLYIQGNVIGRVEKYAGEYWCYLTEGTKKVKVLSNNYEPVLVEFETFGISGLVAKQTYVLTIMHSEIHGLLESHSIDIFNSQVYSLQNIFECDGKYTGDMDTCDYSKTLYVKLPSNFNRQAFSFECSFYPESLAFIDPSVGWDYHECPLFNCGHGAFEINLNSDGRIYISTDYNDKHIYITKCQYSQKKWNIFKLSYNHGKLKIICNGMYDEMDIIASAGWPLYEVLSEDQGNGQTFRGYFQDISIKTEIE